MLVEFGRRFARSVVDVDCDLRMIAARASAGSGEDHVVHVGGAQRLVRGLAHDPAQRLDQIGFAAAVRAHHAGEAGLDQEIGRLDERFEADEAQAREFHAAAASWVACNCSTLC